MLGDAIAASKTIQLKSFEGWCSMWNWSIGIWRMWSKTDNLSDAKFWETSEKQIKLSCCSLSILTEKPCFYLKAVHTFFSTMPGHNDCHGFRSSTVWNVNNFMQVHKPWHFFVTVFRVADVGGARERRSTKGKGLLRKEGPPTYAILSRNLVLSQCTRFLKGCHRALNENHPAFVELSTKAILLS